MHPPLLAGPRPFAIPLNPLFPAAVAPRHIPLVQPPHDYVPEGTLS